MPGTALVVPPDYGWDYPPLGTPALAGFLKARGMAVSQVDLNVAYRDSWGTPRDSVRDRINRHFDEKASGLYYSPLLPQNAGGHSYGFVYGNRANSSFYFTERLLSSEHLCAYLEDEDENTFLRFYLEHEAARLILSSNPALVGISVISPSQAVAALTLCRVLKRKAQGVPIALGGPWVSLYAEPIMDRPDWAGLFDFAVLGEGETPLHGLLLSIEGRGSLSDVPNLVRRERGAWTRNSLSSEEDLNLLPAPDFDGLPLTLYAESKAGRAALTYETSRGCYWNKCAYCVDLPLPKPSFREKSPDLAVADMRLLAARHPVRSLALSNATMSPRQMRELSERLGREDFAVPWTTMARLDRGFTRAIFDAARDAGCQRVNFGFESASDRVCDLVLKGNRREVSRRVIRDCHEAGIQVCLQTMFGLPTETVEEGLETVAFIAENRRFIDDVAYNVYYLTPKCPIHQDPGRWGISREDGAGKPFRFFNEFRQTSGGMSLAEAERLLQLCVGLLNRRKVHLVENHNEVLGVWRKLELSGLPLVHLDAHMDFGWVPDKDISQILAVNTKAELDALLASRPAWNPFPAPKDALVHIGNFVCPAMREGIVREFYWVVPDHSIRHHKERKHLVRSLKAVTKTAVKTDGNRLVTEIAGKKTVVCGLEDLPRFDGPVLLDIDLDYLLTARVTDDLSPAREPWITPEALAGRLAGLGLKPECSTISYSVEGGFTPLRFKHLGDELKERLQAPLEKREAPMPPAARLYREALSRQEQGDLEAARTLYRKAVCLDPSYRTAYNNAGPVCEVLGLHDRAEKAFQDALSLDPDNAFALCGLGNISLDRGDPRAAGERYRRALELAPDLVGAHLGLGRVLLESPDAPAEAAAEFRKALELAPDSAAAYFHLGLIEAREGRHRAALSHLRRARRLGLDTGETHWLMGRSLIREKRYLKAAAELCRAAAAALAAGAGR